MTLQSLSRANSWRPQCLKMCSVEICGDGCPVEDSQHLLHSVDRLIIDEFGGDWGMEAAARVLPLADLTLCTCNKE